MKESLLHGGADRITVKLVANFPDFLPEPSLAVPNNVRGSNPLSRPWDLPGEHHYGKALFNVFGASRPDLIEGVHLYIDDPTLAGGRRINRAAFSIPPSTRQGTLGRNALRGFPATQLYFALHRQFSLTEHWTLQVRAELFNVFNHPNFADPESNLNEGALFGQSIMMLARSLGGLNPLYQTGVHVQPNSLDGYSFEVSRYRNYFQFDSHMFDEIIPIANPFIEMFAILGFHQLKASFELSRPSLIRIATLLERGDRDPAGVGIRIAGAI